MLTKSPTNPCQKPASMEEGEDQGEVEVREGQQLANQPDLFRTKQTPFIGKLQYYKCIILIMSLFLTATKPRECQEPTVTRLEEIIKLAREKKTTPYLEPLEGIGSTSSRLYMKPGKLDQSFCEFCGAGQYTCLGPSCKGRQPLVSGISGNYNMHPPNPNIRIPGLLYASPQVQRVQFKKVSSQWSRRKKNHFIKRSSEVKKRKCGFVSPLNIRRGVPKRKKPKVRSLSKN